MPLTQFVIYVEANGAIKIDGDFSNRVLTYGAFKVAIEQLERYYAALDDKEPAKVETKSDIMPAPPGMKVPFRM